MEPSMEEKSDLNARLLSFGSLPPTEDDKEELLTIDEFLDRIGQLGKFQICVLVLVGFIVIVPAYRALFMVFAAESPPWQCSGVNKHECNSTTLFTVETNGYQSRCSMNRSSWKHTIPKSYSIVTQFELVCSRNALTHVASSALFIGEIIFGLPIGWISDRYGRKRVLFACYIGLCTFAFTSTFSPNVWVYIIFRMLSGGAFGGITISVVVVCLELVGPKYRTLSGTIFWTAWTAGLCFLSLQSYLIPEWKMLTIITSAPYLVFTLGALFVPESVRWYRSQHKIHEAESVLRHVAKVNNRKIPANKHLQPINEKTEISKASYKDLFSTLTVCCKTLTLCFMWFTNDLNYYGIAMVSGDVGGSLHRDFVLFSIVEIPAALATIYLLDKIGRRKGVVIGYAVTSSSLICFGLMQQFSVRIIALRLSLGIIAKIFNILSWCGTEIWTGELYPTILRSQAIGMCFIVSQVGSAVSPWIAVWLKHYSISLPFFIFGGFPFVAGCLALRLKETKGEHIEDVVEETRESTECIQMTDPVNL